MDPDPDEAPGSSASFSEAARRSDIALVLMGPDWLRSEDEHASRRLWNPDDPVRRAVAAAMSAEVVLLPVLIRGARMPDPKELPAEISALAMRNALVTQTSWDYDVTRVAELAKHWR